MIECVKKNVLSIKSRILKVQNCRTILLTSNNICQKKLQSCAYTTLMYRLLILASIVSTLWGLNWNNLFSGNKKSITNMSQQTTTIPTWDDLHQKILSTSTGQSIKEQELFRSQGAGLPHTDAKLRLFGTTEEPRVLFYRDTAAWCPYCQKVWILLEEKQIPYKLEKINMRSYGDKPAEFLRMVPNGLLPAIVLDGQMQTDSLAIMLNLDRTFTGSKHKAMLPNKNSEEYIRAEKLFRLERTLFSSWCSLVFRQPSRAAIQSFEDDLDQVNTELSVTASPWFLDDFSIVDLTYIT